MLSKFWSVLLVITSLAIIAYGFSLRIATPSEQTHTTASTTSPSTLAVATTTKKASPAPKLKLKPAPPKETTAVILQPSTPITETSAPATSTNATTTNTPQSEPTSTPVTTGTQPPPPAPTDYAGQVELDVHTLVNGERATYGLPALSYNTEIASLARSHSADMRGNNYFEHDDLHGCGITCRFQSIHYSYWAIGENIYMMYGYTLSAEAAAQKIVAGWMGSTGHRENILSGNYVTEGVGVAVSGDKVYATEDFAKPR